jgi:hypothetical protein
VKVTVASIGLDIDGVMANFAGAANRYLATACGTDPKPVDRWDWFRNYEGGERAWRNLWRHIERHPGWFTELTPEPFALAGVLALRDLGIDLAFITARPLWSRQATLDWFEKHGMSDLPVYFTKDKHTVPMELYVDDHVDHVRALHENDKRALLMLQPWNEQEWRDDENLFAIEDLLALVEGITGGGI